jgi:hypothetical protein
MLLVVHIHIYESLVSCYGMEDVDKLLENWVPTSFRFTVLFEKLSIFKVIFHVRVGLKVYFLSSSNNMLLSSTQLNARFREMQLRNELLSTPGFFRWIYSEFFFIQTQGNILNLLIYCAFKERALILTWTWFLAFIIFAIKFPIKIHTNVGRLRVVDP